MSLDPSQYPALDADVATADALAAASNPPTAPLSDDALAAQLNARAPTPRVSDPATTYVTYLSIGEMPSPFDGNTAGNLRTTLIAWSAGVDLSTINPALPNPGRLAMFHARLDGSPGVDLTSADAPGLLALFVAGVPTVHAPILTAAQSAALLALGYVVPFTGYLAGDVTASRARIAHGAAAEATLAAIETWASYARNAANAYAAGTATALPTVPGVPTP